MRDTTLNLIAISIFAVTMMALLGPILNLSPAVPAVAIASLLGIATLDQVGLDGRIGHIIVDSLAWTSSEHRQRVAYHEAGHFLVATLLEIPVVDYTLSTWETWRRGLPGQGGVVFDTTALEANQDSDLALQTLERYCQIWMAGIAAEQLIYGAATGGADDCQKLYSLWQQIGHSPSDSQIQQRWALLRAKNLLEKHKDTLCVLAQAMATGESVEACIAKVAATLNSVA